MALIIGNSDYNGDGRVDPLVASSGMQNDLVNPVRDARDVASMLGADYGDPEPVLNADFTAMQSAITRFALAVQRADRDADERNEPRPIVVLYFAGHGIEVSQGNFLLPVRAVLPPANEMEGVNYTLAKNMLAGQAMAVDDILALFNDRGAGATVIVLDACRNNPWARSARGARRALSEEGLAAIPSVGSLLVVTSAEPTRVAEDGAAEAGNSPFARAFLDVMSRRELSFLDAYTEVASMVFERTARRQRPWMTGSPSSRFCLLQCNDPSTELRDFVRVARAGALDDYQQYLQSHDEGYFRFLANDAIDALGDPAARQRAEDAERARDAAARLAREREEQRLYQASVAEAERAGLPPPPPAPPRPPAPVCPSSEVNVYFEYSRRDLNQEAGAALAALAQWTQRCPFPRIEVVGYASTAEGNSRDDVLAAFARTLAVAEHLRGQGLPLENFVRIAIFQEEGRPAPSGPEPLVRRVRVRIVFGG